jgi:cation transport regulator ChaC
LSGLPMWIFGYGSLMADKWENERGCTRRCHASLEGFSRSFDKKSVESRGTPANPAPTLRLVPSDKSCHGIAFEFPSERESEVRACLLDREGKTFPLRKKTIRLDDGTDVEAWVPMYEGKGLIRGKSLAELASMAIKARGIRSSGVEYVQEIAAHLQSANVADPVVADLLREIESQMQSLES